MSKVIAIPNKKILKQGKELVLMPRRNYEVLRKLSLRAVPEVGSTALQRKAIRASEKELKRGQYLTLDELENELGSSYTKTSR